MLEIRNTTKHQLPTATLRIITEAFFKKYKLSGLDVSLAVVGNRAIHSLNFRYRGMDKPTDVLSFSSAGLDPASLGEIVISWEYMERQAKKDGKPVKREFLFIFVHGLLHLIGHDDNTEAKRQKMIELGEKFLQSLSL